MLWLLPVPEMVQEMVQYQCQGVLDFDLRYGRIVLV
jgi:hypothetical protein